VLPVIGASELSFFQVPYLQPAKSAARFGIRNAICKTRRKKAKANCSQLHGVPAL
jgi:hypothetical protein